MMHVDIPPLYLPLPEWNHPDCEQVSERCVAELADHGLCETERLERVVLDCRAGEFASRFAPWAPTEKLLVSAKMFGMLFLLDNLIDSTTPDAGSVSALGYAFARALQVPGLRSPELGIFGPATRHLGRRANAIGTPAQVVRLANAMRTWIAGCAWQFSFTGRSEPPDIDTFMTMRMYSGGICINTTWFDFFTPAPLPAEVFDDPAVQAMNEAMQLVCALDNDLTSFGMERWTAEHRSGVGSDTASNLVALLMAHGASLDQALKEAVDLRNVCMVRLLELHKQLLGGADPVLAGWLDNVVQAVRGLYDWHYHAPRYTNPDGDHPDAITMTASIVDTPPEHTEPPPYSSIRWWWEV